MTNQHHKRRDNKFLHSRQSENAEQNAGARQRPRFASHLSAAQARRARRAPLEKATRASGSLLASSRRKARAKRRLDPRGISNRHPMRHQPPTRRTRHQLSEINDRPPSQASHRICTRPSAFQRIQPSLSCRSHSLWPLAHCNHQSKVHLRRPKLLLFHMRHLPSSPRLIRSFSLPKIQLLSPQRCHLRPNSVHQASNHHFNYSASSSTHSYAQARSRHTIGTNLHHPCYVSPDSCHADLRRGHDSVADAKVSQTRHFHPCRLSRALRKPVRIPKHAKRVLLPKVEVFTPHSFTSDWQSRASGIDRLALPGTAFETSVQHTCLKLHAMMSDISFTA